MSIRFLLAMVFSVALVVAVTVLVLIWTEPPTATSQPEDRPPPDAPPVAGGSGGGRSGPAPTDTNCAEDQRVPRFGLPCSPLGNTSR